MGHGPGHKQNIYQGIEMSKAKAVTKAELESKVAALEARIVVATEVYRNQRARIEQLEAQLNARGAAKTIPVTIKAQPVVTRWTRADGAVMEKTRVGNMATSRVVRDAPDTDRDLAHESDMAELRREQLAADFDEVYDRDEDGFDFTDDEFDEIRAQDARDPRNAKVAA